MKHVGKILSLSQTGRNIQSVIQGNSKHAATIANDRSTHFHIGRPYVSKNNRGVDHIHTDDLHYCSAAIARLNKSGRVVGGVHYEGSNISEVDDTIRQLKRFRKKIKILISRNDKAVHPVHDQPFYKKYEDNFSQLVKRFNDAGFDVETIAGSGRTFGVCAKHGIFKENHNFRDLLASNSCSLTP